MVLFFTSSFPVLGNELRTKNESNLPSLLLNNRISNSFELVFKDGQWWIYEYDEDGRLINVFPVDD